MTVQRVYMLKASNCKVKLVEMRLDKDPIFIHKLYENLAQIISRIAPVTLIPFPLLMPMAR